MALPVGMMRLVVRAAWPSLVMPRIPQKKMAGLMMCRMSSELQSGSREMILGIETSCDDTGAAVVTTDGRILGEALSSQTDLLKQWGGVVPKLAQDAHAQAIDRVVAEALGNAGVQEGDLSAVAVTIGPGLSMCLRVGVSKAREIARVHRLPMVGVHHMEAHALVARLTEEGVEFPFVVLLVSGGHNLLLLAQDVGQYTQLGTTVDDAIGEAYDKTARLLGLDLKLGGGPALEKLALEGDSNAYQFSVPMRHRQDCNFSYAGLKNQVRMAIAANNINAQVPLSETDKEERRLRADLAASFQRVAVLHLEEKCRRALKLARTLDPSVQCLVVSGGVASNQVVRSRLNYISQEVGVRLVCPPPRLCTDNGVMVAWAGVEHYKKGMIEPPPPIDESLDCWLDLRPRWQLGEIHEEGVTDAHKRSVKKLGTHPSLTAQVRSFAAEEKVYNRTKDEHQVENELHQDGDFSIDVTEEMHIIVGYPSKLLKAHELLFATRGKADELLCGNPSPGFPFRRVRFYGWLVSNCQPLGEPSPSFGLVVYKVIPDPIDENLSARVSLV